MKIIRTFVPDSFENFNHFAYCPVSREAAAIDPFSAEHLLTIANHHNVHIKQIWITHEHGDHIRDVQKLKELTGAKIHAPVSCEGKFKADYWLENDQQLTLGQSTAIHILTPGHTFSHGVFFFTDISEPKNDFLICGDTLFNAGVGNVKSGNVKILHNTIKMLATKLTPTTQIFPGHDYLVTNLKFTLHHCPDFKVAQTVLDRVENQTPDQREIQTWADELNHNLFLNLNSYVVMSVTNITGEGDKNQERRFIALRDLRDKW